MTVMTPMHTFPANGGRVTLLPWLWQWGATAPHMAAESPDEARISPLLVYPAVFASSLVLWFALGQLLMWAARLTFLS